MNEKRFNHRNCINWQKCVWMLVTEHLLNQKIKIKDLKLKEVQAMERQVEVIERNYVFIVFHVT